MASTDPPQAPRRHGLFIDESGHAHHNHYVIDPNNPYLTVCGVLFTDTAYVEFRQVFRKLKQEFFGNTEIVFHSRDIRKKQGAFRILADDAINVYFISELNKVISGADFEIMAILIDKKHYIQLRPFSAFEIYTIALKFLMERTLYRLQPKSPQPHHRPNVVNILAEARGGNEDTRLLRAYNTFLDTGNDYNTPERFKTLFTGFSFKRKADHVDGLELADLCAYPIGKHIWDPLQSHPSYSILEPKLMKTRKKGGAEGVGIKRFPAPGAVRSLWHP